MIELSSINKTFKVARRNAGFGEAVKALFKKEYTFIHALNDVSFKIDDGEMVGYIGPNGAGKSSTIKIMSGILNPDNGECVINGLTPWKNRREHVRNIGVVFGQRSQLWWDVPVIDSFELIRDIYKVNALVYTRNLNELTEMLDLSELLRTPARQLSLGQRMRCEIAASLLHEPKILFLDEPTIGLDAVSKISVRNFIKKINRDKKTTVILTTHDMQDIEALTERIILIGKGQILLDGSLSELKNRNSKIKTITLDYTIGKFERTCGISKVNEIDGHAMFAVDTDIISVSAAIEALSKNADITDLSVAGPSAEEMVVSLYEEFKI
jgi:ABC-2 type transport system ATP-binding protein